MRSNLILLILAAILAVPTTITLMSSDIDFTIQSEVPLLFSGFNPDNVVTIHIRATHKDANGELVPGTDGKPVTDDLIINRVSVPGEDDHWVFGGTDPDLLGVRVRRERPREYVLDHMGRITFDDRSLVTEGASQEELKRYGLEDENSEMVLVRCFDKVNKLLCSLLLGRSTKEGRKGKGIVRGYFVRRPSRSDVILYEQDFWQLSTNKQQWVDRNVFYRFPADQAVEVTLSNVMGKVSFRKEHAEDVDWLVQEGPEGVGAVRQAEVNALISTLQLIDAPRFIRPLAAGPALEADLLSLGLAEPDISVEVRLQNGARKSLKIGNKLPDQNFFHSLVSTLPHYVLGFGDYQLHPFEAKPNKFFDPPASAAIKDQEDSEKPSQAKTVPPSSNKKDTGK